MAASGEPHPPEERRRLAATDRRPAHGNDRSRPSRCGPDRGATGSREGARHSPRAQFLRDPRREGPRSEEHTSELQSLMRISYAVFCLKKKKTKQTKTHRKEQR